MIVVATGDFEVYHGVVGELRDRDATFTTVAAGDPLPEGTDVVLVAEGDPRPEEGDGLATVVADPDRPARAVERALSAVRERPRMPGEGTDGAGGAADGDGDRSDGSGRTVVGVDPGERPGIAVLSGGTVVAAYQVPLAEAVGRVRTAVEGAPDPVVRVGDGARLQGARLVEALDDVRVELVDETGTTPHLGAGARGAGDLLAAVNIARLDGDPVESRTVEPTAGELQVIKTESRERSPQNREIDEALARRVARGELTVEEALAEHRGDRPDPPGDD